MHGPAGGRVLAGYCLWSAGARIVICDGGGPTTPRMRQDGGLAEGGRGLQVIDGLAARWGSFRLSGAQVVWCDFGQPLRAPAGDAWAWLGAVLSACPLSPAAPARARAVPRQARLANPVTVPGLSGHAPMPTPAQAAPVGPAPARPGTQPASGLPAGSRAGAR